MTTQIRRFIIVFSLLFSIAFSLASPLFAQAPQDFAHRHPTMTAVAAGAGTTYLLKKSARYKKEHGERLNFAEKHPYLSGIGVTVVTHHVLAKKHKDE